LNQIRVLVVSSSRSVRRHVTRALGSVGFASTPCAMDRDAISAALGTSPTMCIIDADDDLHHSCWVLEELYKNHQDVIVLLISHERENSILLDLLQSKNLNNLIAKHGGLSTSSELIDENELMVTCNKLLRHDIFGLEKYLPTWGIKMFAHELSSTDDKPRVMGELAEFLNTIDCYGPIKQAVELVADELLMNAIFNAPRDDQGQAKYNTLDRSIPLVLEPHERVAFQYACDGRNIALSVRDQFGSLDRDVIIKYVQRCFSSEPAEIENKKGGAGLGLYMVFNSITQLTFNLQRGVATEVIASFYIRSGARAFRSSGRSLNIFVTQ
jgi:hypothetical protein